MEKIYSRDLDIDVQKAPKISRDKSIIYKSNNGELIKIFGGNTIKNYRKDLVDKLSNPIDINGVVGPNKLVYVHDNLIGYTMDNIEGRNDIDFESGLDAYSKNNLYRIADKYMQLEKIVKDAGNNIVFPGLLDRENIIVDPNLDIHILGYDNLQINDLKAVRRSDSLGDSIEFLQSKYYDGEKYSKELDIRSLTLYYLELAFGLNLRDGFNIMDLVRALGEAEADDAILKKISSVLDPSVNSDYLGEDVYLIAGAYDLLNDNNPDTKMTKRLRPKWME